MFCKKKQANSPMCDAMVGIYSPSAVAFNGGVQRDSFAVAFETPVVNGDQHGAVTGSQFVDGVCTGVHRCARGVQGCAQVCTWCARGVHVGCTWGARMCTWGARVCTWDARGVHRVCTVCARCVHVGCTSSARGVHGMCMCCARGVHVRLVGNADWREVVPIELDGPPSFKWLSGADARSDAEDGVIIQEDEEDGS